MAFLRLLAFCCHLHFSPLLREGLCRLGVETLLWGWHSWSSAAADWGLLASHLGTSPVSWSQAWVGLDTGSPEQGVSAPKAGGLCAYTCGCLRVWLPHGEWACGGMNFFPHQHMALLLCLFRSVPHTLLCDLVCAQMHLLWACSVLQKNVDTRVPCVCTWGYTHVCSERTHGCAYMGVLRVHFTHLNLVHTGVCDSSALAGVCEGCPSREAAYLCLCILAILCSWSFPSNLSWKGYWCNLGQEEPVRARGGWCRVPSQAGLSPR